VVGFGRKLLKPNFKHYRSKYVEKQGKLTCSRVVPVKLTVPQLVRKFPAFYQTQRYIAVFTRARHMSLSFAGEPSERPLILFLTHSFQYNPPIYVSVS